MDNEFKILIDAGLDDNAKKHLQNDIDNKLNNLEATIKNLKLDPQALQSLTSALAQNGINLNVGINVPQSQVKQAQQVGQKIGQQISKSIQDAIQKDSNAMEKLSQFTFDGKKNNRQNDTAQRAKKEFESLNKGIVTIHENMKSFGDSSELDGFIVNIKKADGSIESLTYALSELEDKSGKVFKYISGSINDNGVVKQFTAIENAIASYEQKVAQFKSTNEGILSGINFEKFDNALTALKNGTGSINTVKNAYKDLGVQASTITKELSGQLSKTGTAVRNIAKGSETISGLRAEFKGLNNAPKDINKQLNTLETNLNNINDIESDFGRNADWAKAYRKWQDEIDVLTAKLRVLKKEQSNASSSQVLSMTDLTKGGRAYISKVSNSINKNSTEVQKMATAHGWTDWDITGIERADGMVKKLTVTFTDAEGAIKRFIMQRDKIVSAKGNEYNALVQTGDVQIIKSAISAEKELANAIGSRREQAEQSRKEEENRLDVAQSKAQNKAIEEEYKNQEKLTEAMAKGREKSELARKEEERKLQLLQTKASNKAIEDEVKEQENLVNAMAKAREETELSRKAEEKRISDAQNKAINKNIEQEAKEQQKVADAIDKQIQKSQEARKEEEKRLSLAQNKAINKNIEQEEKERQKIIDAIDEQVQKTQEARKIEEKKLSDAQNKAINKNIEQQAKDSAKKKEQAEKAINTQLSIQKKVLGEIILLDREIANLDPDNEAEQIADLKNQQKLKRDIYDTSRQHMKTIAQEVMETEELVALEKRRRDEMKETATVARQTVSALNEKSANKEADKQTNKINDIDNKIADGSYKVQIDELISKFQKYGLTVEQAEDKVHNLRSALTQMSDSNITIDERINAENQYQSELVKTRNELKQTQLAFGKYAQPASDIKIANTIVRIQDLLSKNTRATREVRMEWERYIQELKSGSGATVGRLEEINLRLKQSESEMRILGKLGKSLSDQMKQAAKDFTQWVSVSSLLMAGWHKSRQAVTELKEIDTYLTEISKANDKLSKSDLVEIGNNSFDIASKYGKTATDFLSGVQEASRAGYVNAEGIAELSTAAQGAGDMTADVANQMIIATDKAYKMAGAVDTLRTVLDGVNYITNHNAVNMTELSEGMTIVASTAASFGVEIDELISALGTMSASTQQSGSEVARAFRAVLLNIRQVSDEEEGITAEGLTKYEAACNALGVSLKETKNGVLSLRDPMEVLKELSIEYNKLEESDIKRTNLLNSVGGKLRATQLDALLRQWSMYEKMLDEYEAGTGSMAVEAEKTAQSWEGSLNRLSNTFADTVGNIVQSDAMIMAINTLNEFLGLINSTTDALGSLGSVGMIGSAIAGAKGLG